MERRVAVEATNTGVAVPPLLRFAFRRMVRPLGFEPRCPKATVFEAAASAVPPGAHNLVGLERLELSCREDASF